MKIKIDARDAEELAGVLATEEENEMLKKYNAVGNKHGGGAASSTSLINLNFRLKMAK